MKLKYFAFCTASFLLLSSMTCEAALQDAQKLTQEVKNDNYQYEWKNNYWKEFQMKADNDEAEDVYISTKLLEQYSKEIGTQYGLDDYLLYALVEVESNRKINAKNGKCKGLCQVSEKWHKNRMEKLEIETIYDPYNNMLLAADFLAELLEEKNDIYYALMRYNMKIETANDLYNQGIVSDYAKKIVNRADELKNQ